MFDFKLVLVVCFCLDFFLYANSSVQDGCYHSIFKTGETWKIVWQDEFESDQLSNWKVDHETNKCRYVDTSQTNCHHRENVWTTDGLMVMMVKQEKYANRSFTGASITTEHIFSYGRIEIRAIVPTDQYISVKFSTYNDNDEYWTKSGQIYIMDVYKLSNYRGFYPFGSSGQEHFILNHFTLNKNINNTFHRYGVEWDAEKIKFFFDEKYGEAIVLRDNSRVKQPQQLRIKIRVFKDADFAKNKINWNCPALLVDYVRVFEKVQLDENLDENEIKSKQCVDKFEIQEQQIVNGICAVASTGKGFKNSKKSTQSPTENLVIQYHHMVYATISLLIIIIVLLFAFVVYQFIVPRNVATTNATASTSQNEFELHDYSEILE